MYLITILFSIHISFTVQQNNPVNRHHTIVAYMFQRRVTQWGTPFPIIFNMVVEAYLRDWVTSMVYAVFLHWVTLVEVMGGYYEPGTEGLG